MSHQQDLFSIQASLSPKLAWMNRNGITTHYCGIDDHSAQESAETGEPIYPWICYRNNERPGVDVTGCGDSESEAIFDFCEKSGIKHWTVEETK